MFEVLGPNLNIFRTQYLNFFHIIFQHVNRNGVSDSGNKVGAEEGRKNHARDITARGDTDGSRVRDACVVVGQRGLCPHRQLGIVLVYGAHVMRLYGRRAHEDIAAGRSKGTLLPVDFRDPRVTQRPCQTKERNGVIRVGKYRSLGLLDGSEGKPCSELSLTWLLRNRGL